MKNTLRLETFAVVDELPSGNARVYPLANPTLSSFGDPERALDELKLYLAHHLKDSDAETLARFALPTDARLERVLVELPRHDLDRRSQVEGAVEISCVVLPSARGAWVQVLRPAHTFFLLPDEELAEVVRSEVKRLVAALQPEPREWLDLLPPADVRLERVVVELERLEDPGRRAAAAKKRLLEAEQKRAAYRVLDSVGTRLHEAPDWKRSAPLVGHEDQLESLRSLLSASPRGSVLVVGPELVGKTALIKAWSQAVRASGEELKLYATSGAQLVAGMSGLGQWQERLRRVLEAAERIDAVLYFDNIGDLFGDRAEGGIDLPSAMRPWLERGRVRIVGEISPTQADLLELSNVGFFSAFHRVRLRPSDAKHALEVLRERNRWLRRHEPHRVRLVDAALPRLIDLVERFLPYRAFPGKAVRFYEEVRASFEHQRHDDGSVSELVDSEVVSTLAVQTGMPINLLREDRALDLDEVRAFFQQRLIGQREAIERVVSAIAIVKASLGSSGKPLANFLFVGPTGVGKTELARTLATYLFESPERLVRFDMSEFTDPFAAERLIRGTDREEGLLTRQLRRQPFCVLLLDEIEKAHPSVFDLLLQVLGEGRLSDAKGRTAYFHNAIVIMTSNLGAAHRRARIGLGTRTESDDEEYYAAAVQRHFRPEFVNRLDAVVTFHALSEAEVQQVAQLLLAKLRGRRGLAERGLKLEVADEALLHLCREGYSAAYGARALRRTLEDALAAPVAELVSEAGGAISGSRIRVEHGPSAGEGTPVRRLQQGELVFDVERGAARVRAEDVTDFQRIAMMRRSMQQWLDLDPVDELRERRSFLLAQLSHGQRKSSQAQAEIGALQAEFHHLDGLWQQGQALRDELDTFEELALESVLGSSPSDKLVHEAEDAFGRFRHHLAHLLVALYPKPHELSFLLTELDSGRALDAYLISLIKALPKRQWQARFHPLAARVPPEEGWRKERPWSSPRAGDWVLEFLERKDRKADSVLVRLRGQHVGPLLSVEGGLHRFHGILAGNAQAHLDIKILGWTRDLDEHWLKPTLKPTEKPTGDLKKLPALREHFVRERRVEMPRAKWRRPLSGAGYFVEFEEVALFHLLRSDYSANRGVLDGSGEDDE